MDRKTRVIAQIMITTGMATLMAGTMSLIVLGPTKEWLTVWPRQVAIAWPFAFVFSQIVSPLAFAVAVRMTRRTS